MKSLGIFAGDVAVCAQLLWIGLIESRDELAKNVLREIHLIDVNARNIDALQSAILQLED